MALSREEYETFNQDRYLNELFSGFKDSKFRINDPLMNRSGSKTGYGVFGHDFANSVLTDPEFRAKYYKQGGQTFDQWLNNLDKEFGGIKAYAQGQKMLGKPNLFDDERLQDFFKFDTVVDDKGQTAEEVKMREEEAKRAQTMKEIEDFAATMMKDLSPDDPEVQRLSQIATNSAATQARLQGVQGPMSIANSQQASSNALGAYGIERKQIGANALAMKHNAQVGQFQQQELAARQRWEDQVGLSELRKSRDPGQYIAGAGGALIGGVGGFFAGGPAGAAAGAGAGWNLGKGMYGGLSGGGGPGPYRSRYSGY